MYSRVSSGSDSFYLYVEDGNGNVNYTTVSKSGTITINDFNGFDPSGKWKIWIVTKGTVSTSTETIKYIIHIKNVMWLQFCIIGESEI